MPAPFPGMLAPKKPPSQYTFNPNGEVPKSQPVPQAPAGQPTFAPTSVMPKANIPQPPQNYQDMGATDQFKHFQTNPDVGRAELTRATNQSNIYKAAGDMDKYNAAQDWIGKVNTVMSGIPSAPDPNVQRHQQFMQQQDEIMGKLKGFMETPAQYNPEMDPRYQAFRQLSQARAKDASRAAMEELNNRGILNSSVTGTQLGEIQQNAEQQALAAVPDFYNQAMNQRQNDIRNAGDLLRSVGDQAQLGLDNQYRDKAFDRGVYVDNRNFGYGQQRDTVKDDQWKQTMDYQKLSDQQKIDYQKARDSILDDRDKRNFDEDVRRNGLDYGLRQAQAKISQQNANTSSANAGRSATNEQQDALYKQWQYSGKAPAGIPGVQPGTLYRTEVNNNPPSKVDPKESADNYSVIISDLDPRAGVTKDKAKQLAQANRDHLSDTDYRKLLDYIEKEF